MHQCTHYCMKSWSKMRGCCKIDECGTGDDVWSTDRHPDGSPWLIAAKFCGSWNTRMSSRRGPCMYYDSNGLLKAVSASLYSARTLVSLTLYLLRRTPTAVVVSVAHGNMP